MREQYGASVIRRNLRGASFCAVARSRARGYNAVMDAETIKLRRQRRTDFMRRLYDVVDGSVSEFVSGFDLASELGAEAEEARRIMAYLEEKGLIKVDDHRNGIVRITAAGVDDVETTLAG